MLNSNLEKKDHNVSYKNIEVPAERDLVAFKTVQVYFFLSVPETFGD